MRITVNPLARVGDTHVLQHFDRVLARLFPGVTQMKLGYLHQLLGDPHERIERGHRILKNHGDAPAANCADFARAKLQHVATVKHYRAGNDLSGRIGN